MEPGCLDVTEGEEFSPAYWSIKPIFAVRTGLDDRPDDKWHFNPLAAIRECDREVVRLWFMAGGREGLRHLPQAGGVLDQAAVMMDAFAIIATAVASYPLPKTGEE